MRRIFQEGTGESDGFPSAAFFSGRMTCQVHRVLWGQLAKLGDGRVGPEGTPSMGRSRPFPPGRASGFPRRSRENVLPRLALTRSDKCLPQRVPCPQSLVTGARWATGTVGAKTFGESGLET